MSVLTDWSLLSSLPLLPFTTYAPSSDICRSFQREKIRTEGNVVETKKDIGFDKSHGVAAAG